MQTNIQQLYEQIPASVCTEGCAKCCRDLIQVAPEESVRMGGYKWDGQCVFLQNNRCSVHSNRAFICRLFGVSEIMRCGGCVPERCLTEAETKNLVQAYTRLKNQQENMLQGAL